MSNRHFKQAMTWGTEGYKVLWPIGPVLVLKITAGLDVVNVQTATAWAALGTAILADLIAVTYITTNGLPIAAMFQFLAAPIMGTVFTDHEFSGTLNRTKAATIFSHALECAKGLAAVLAVEVYGCYLALVGTLGRTMANGRGLLVKPLATDGTVDIGHLGTTPSKVTFLGTKEILLVLDSIWRPLKFLAAIVTGYGNALAKGINRTLARTMIDYRLVSLEFFATLEARFDHQGCL